MKSLFNEKTYLEIKKRLENISENSEKQWGEMHVAQMLYHCQKPLLVGLQKEKLAKPNFLFKMASKLIKPMFYNDKVWKRGLPTAKELKVTSTKDFDLEKQKLTSLIEEFHQKKNQEKWEPHPIFGAFTKEQWGKMQYKHLDHHLTQFGV